MIKKSIPQQLTNLKNYGTNKYVKDEQVKYIGTRHPDWPVNEKKIFPEQQIKHKADKIVDKHYEQNKNKSPFTQVAENAVKELEFKYNSTTGTFRNNDGKTLPMKEALETTEALDKNFRDHKEDDYLKVSNPPILRNNINNPKIINPTVKKYKDFKENQKKKLEDKKFDEQFKKDYSDQAIENYVRGKVNKNIKAGKAPYEDLPSSYLIVGEHAKDKAKKKLAEIKIEHTKLEPSYIDYRLNLKDIGPTISLEEHIAQRAPKEIDPLGITGLEEVKNFRNVVDMSDQKFPQRARGIGPYISGEDDPK